MLQPGSIVGTLCWTHSYRNSLLPRCPSESCVEEIRHFPSTCWLFFCQYSPSYSWPSCLQGITTNSCPGVYLWGLPGPFGRAATWSVISQPGLLHAVVPLQVQGFALVFVINFPNSPAGWYPFSVLSTRLPVLMPIENFVGIMLCPIVQVIGKNVKHCYVLQGMYQSFLVQTLHHLNS